MRLLLQDGIDVGLCAKGQRRFCRAHGIDYAAFVREGIEFDKLAGIVDANLERAMQRARDRIEGQA